MRRKSREYLGSFFHVWIRFRLGHPSTITSHLELVKWYLLQMDRALALLVLLATALPVFHAQSPSGPLGGRFLPWIGVFPHVDNRNTDFNARVIVRSTGMATLEGTMSSMGNYEGTVWARKTQLHIFGQPAQHEWALLKGEYDKACYLTLWRQIGSSTCQLVNFTRCPMLCQYWDSKDNFYNRSCIVVSFGGLKNVEVTQTVTYDLGIPQHSEFNTALSSTTVDFYPTGDDPNITFPNKC